MCKDVNRDKVISRIKKLLEVTESRGATENEALAAALAAQKLIAEYDIEQIELAEDAEPIVSVMSRKGRKWQLYLALAIADNFRCKCYHQLKREAGNKRRTAYMCFFGYSCDAEAAKLVYEKLAVVGNRLANEWADQRVSELKREGYLPVKSYVYNTFASSFVKGVRSVLEKQSLSLMIVRPKAVDDAYEDLGLKAGNFTFDSYSNDTASKDAGFSAGRDAVLAGRIGALNTAPALPA